MAEKALIDYNEGIERIEINKKHVFMDAKLTGWFHEDFEAGIIYVTPRKYPKDWLNKDDSLNFEYPLITKVLEYGAKYLGIEFTVGSMTSKLRYKLSEVRDWPLYDGRPWGYLWQHELRFAPDKMNNLDLHTAKTLADMLGWKLPVVYDDRLDRWSLK